jgi:hypothetical protein
MVQQPTGSRSVSYSDQYCALCGFGPDEQLPGYVRCPDHLWLVVRGHRREVSAPPRNTAPPDGPPDLADLNMAMRPSR